MKKMKKKKNMKNNQQKSIFDDDDEEKESTQDAPSLRVKEAINKFETKNPKETKQNKQPQPYSPYKSLNVCKFKFQPHEWKPDSCTVCGHPKILHSNTGEVSKPSESLFDD